MSMRKLNREALWDNTGEVPSAWGEQKKPSVPDKSMAYFYKKLQYNGSVDQGKRNHKQAVPQSRDILRQKGLNPDQGVNVLHERVQSRGGR